MSRPEDGSITPLIVGLAVVVALLVAVAVDASAAYLRREGLNSLADAAALAATEGVQAESAYVDGLGHEVRIEAASARQLVADYLEQIRAVERYDDLTWTVSIRGRHVVVRVAASFDLPLHVPGTGSRIRVVGGSSAAVTVADQGG